MMKRRITGMASYKDLFNVTSDMSAEQIAQQIRRKVDEKSTMKNDKKAYRNPFNSIKGLSAAMVAFAILAGAGAFWLNGNGGGGNNLTAPAQSSEIIQQPLSYTEPPADNSDERHDRLSRMAEFYNRDINMIENTFDFDVALVDLYGDSRNMFVTFEFTPTGDFEFTEDGAYSLFAGDIPKNWDRSNFLSLTNKKDCYSFEDGHTQTCGGISTIYSNGLAVKNGKAYQTFILPAFNFLNPLHDGYCIKGQELTFYIEGIHTTAFPHDVAERAYEDCTWDCAALYDECTLECVGERHQRYSDIMNELYKNYRPEITGIMEFTFMAEYEANEFFVTEIGKEIKLYGDDDKNIFVIEHVKISDTSIYFNFTSDSLSYDYSYSSGRDFENFDPDNCYYPLDYVLQKIQLRINGKEYRLLNEPLLMNGLRIEVNNLPYEMWGIKYDGDVGGSFYDPYFDITSIEAVIIDGVEFEIITS
jgi:hypothetical protein